MVVDKKKSKGTKSEEKNKDKVTGTHTGIQDTVIQTGIQETVQRSGI